jgi:hypothetical protein
MEKKIEFIKIQIDHLVKEPTTCNGRLRFSHPGWTRKLPKWLTPCDYSKTEKLIEVEYKSGDREWFSLEVFFGKVIAEVKDIFILYPDGETETMSIIGIDMVKIKRTTYWKLIFERDMPF